MTEQRLTELETKVSFQELSIEELRQTVHTQYLIIERLEKSMNLLSNKIKAGGEDIGKADEKPPHY